MENHSYCWALMTHISRSYTSLIKHICYIREVEVGDTILLCSFTLSPCDTPTLRWHVQLLFRVMSWFVLHKTIDLLRCWIFALYISTSTIIAQALLQTQSSCPNLNYSVIIMMNILDALNQTCIKPSISCGAGLRVPIIISKCFNLGKNNPHQI